MFYLLGGGELVGSGPEPAYWWQRRWLELKSKEKDRNLEDLGKEKRFGFFSFLSLLSPLKLASVNLRTFPASWCHMSDYGFVQGCSMRE